MNRKLVPTVLTIAFLALLLFVGLIQTITGLEVSQSDDELANQTPYNIISLIFISWMLYVSCDNYVLKKKEIDKKMVESNF